MSSSPPKRDTWPPWEDVRFVLVRSVGRLRPCRGLVLDWRALGRGRWEALVVYFDDAALRPVTKTEWLARDQLIPVVGGPNYTP